MTDQILRALLLARHPLHTARALLARAFDGPVAGAARRTWSRLWFDERPLVEAEAVGVRQRSGDDRRLRVRIAGRTREAIVLDAPVERAWRTRSQPGGELDLWCAVMPGGWRADGPVRVEIRISGDTDASADLDLSPATTWRHRRWTRVRLPVAGSADVSLAVSTGDGPVPIAIADAAIRWRRPAAEVRMLARAFASRLRRGGLRDTARWAQVSARQAEDRERYRRWCARHTPDTQALASMARGLASWPDRPRFSILTPVYNTDPVWLEACIESVRAQIYPDWELILSDDGSTREETRAVLRTFESDPRVRVVWNGTNRGIAGATQAALDAASGDFVAMLDHDDVLMPHALYRVAARLKASPDLELIYSDEDKLELDGARSDVYFKPDWSPDLFLSSMYVCHFLVMRRSLVVEAGGFRPGYDGSQDYDLVLRVIERARRIEHIPDVLYHWRKIPESASSTGAAKPWAHLAGQRALQDYADRNALDAVVEEAGAPGLYRMRYRLRGEPLVSIVAIARPGFVYPASCRKRGPAASYPNLELIVVARPGMVDEARRRCGDRATVVEASGSDVELLNTGARAARGEHLLFLSPSVEPRHDDWIEALVEHAQRPEVGAVGAKLFHPDGRLRHMGLVVGPDGLGHRSFDGYPGTWAGYFSSANAIRNCFAVSRDAVMVSRAAFERVGGWRSGVADVDVDFGRRLWEAGLRVVFTPYARLTEHDPSWSGDGAGRRPDAAAGGLDRDPYYNLHFAVDSPDHQVRVD